MAVPRGAARSLIGRLGAAAVLAVSANAACDGGRASGGPLSDSTYVEVVAHLSLVRERAPVLDSATADSARVAILREHGVAPEELAEYARRHGDDLERMRRIWEAVAERMDSLAARTDPRRGEDLPVPRGEGEEAGGRPVPPPDTASRLRP